MAFIPIICSQMWLVYRVHVVSREQRLPSSAETTADSCLAQLSERYWPFTAVGIVTVLSSFVSFIGSMVTKSEIAPLRDRRASS